MLIVTEADEHGLLGASLYDEEADPVPVAAVNASLGCGVPTAETRFAAVAVVRPDRPVAPEFRPQQDA